MPSLGDCAMEAVLNAGPCPEQTADPEENLGTECDPPSREQQHQEARLEVASVVAAATTAAAQPSADAAQALKLFRSSLLEMVGACGLYSGQPNDRRSGWGRFTATADDLSCATLIAKYVSLWSVLEVPENQKFSVQALIGLRMLQNENGSVAAAKVFREIEFQTSTPAALSYVMRGIGTFLFGLACVSITLIVTFMVLPGMLKADQADAFRHAVASLDPKWADVSIACIAGMFG